MESTRWGRLVCMYPEAQSTEDHLLTIRRDRGIAVIKMRGSQHEKAIHQFSIDHAGMHIQEPFKGVQNIILGVPVAAMPGEEEQLGDLFREPAPGEL